MAGIGLAGGQELPSPVQEPRLLLGGGAEGSLPSVPETLLLSPDSGYCLRYPVLPRILRAFVTHSLKKGILAGYCFMALRGPRQGLGLASVVLGTGDRLSSLQRVWLYLGAVLGLGYLFLWKMPQHRRSELFSPEMWTEVTAGSHAVLVKWGSLACLAGRGGEGRPGHRAGQSVQGAHCCQSPLVPCLAWLTAAAPRDPILPPSCVSSIAVPALCRAGQSRGRPALPDPPAR